MDLKINEDRLKEHYKDIERQCLVNGCLIPKLLERSLPIDYGGFPKEYRLNSNENNRIILQLSEETKSKLSNYEFKRRLTEQRIYDKEDEKYESFKDYYEDELKTFIKEHPEFKKIL